MPPEVGRSLGKTLRELKGGMDKFRQELNSDREFKEAKSALRDVKKAIDAPRKFADPKRIISEIAKAEPEVIVEAKDKPTDGVAPAERESPD